MIALPVPPARVLRPQPSSEERKLLIAAAAIGQAHACVAAVALTSVALLGSAARIRTIQRTRS